MRRIIPALLAVLALLQFMQLVSGCGGECTCKKYNVLEQPDQATTCRHFRDAVWDYVELQSGHDGQVDQYNRLAMLYDLLKKCKHRQCVLDGIAQDTIIAPDFDPLFAKADSLTRFDLGSAKLPEGKVMLCGLNAGLKDMKDSLGVQ